MLRDLNKNELALVSGGDLSTDLVDVYPPVIPGFALVGWSQQIVGWDYYTWVEQVGVFTTVEHTKQVPIVDIQPIYMPLMSTVVYY
jgi:hypothetical protein